MILLSKLIILYLILNVKGKWDKLKQKIQSDPSFSIKFPAQSNHGSNFMKDGPIGHMEELGKQRPPLGQIPEHFEAPTPQFLWENNMIHYRPAVFRGLLDKSPALSQWNDEYLAKEYGDLDVLVENKYEDRKSEPKRMRIDEFLNQYRDQNWYVVSILPDEMKKDVKIPKPLKCSSLKKHLMELNLWIGTKGTSSMLHYDADNILHCLVSGRKDWILIHPKNAHLSGLAVNNFGQGSGFSVLNANRIDSYNNPDVSMIPWEYVTLYAGDCLYLPSQYMHQVRSYNRSISVTYLIFPHTNFTDDDCANVDLDSYETMENLFVFWGYKKHQETIDMGYRNPNQHKMQLLSGFSKFNMVSCNYKEFVYIILTLGLNDIFEKPQLNRKLFQMLDTDSDGFIQFDEVKNIDIEIVKEFCRQTEDPHGPVKSRMHTDSKLSNTTSEEHFFNANKSFSFLVYLLKKHGFQDAIDFHNFSDIVVVEHGTVTESFVLLDLDMDGILTLNELKTLSKHKLLKFYSFGYNLAKATSDQGSGNFHMDSQEGYEDDDVDDDDDPISMQVATVTQVFEKISRSISLKETVDGRKFDDLLKEVNVNNTLDTGFLFKALDRNGKGYLTNEDVNQIFALDDSETELRQDEPEGIKRIRNHIAEKPESFSRLFLQLLRVMLTIDMNDNDQKELFSAKGKDEL